MERGKKEVPVTTPNRIVILFAAALVLLNLGSCAGRKKVAADTQRAPVSSGISEAIDSPAAGTPSPSSSVETFNPVYFDYDRYNLRPDALEVLSRHAKALSERPNLALRIEGHCDERGTVEYNLALGERRAQAVLEYLVAYGIDRTRLSTTSYGEERPAARGQDEAAWSLNRRAEFAVAGAL